MNATLHPVPSVPPGSYVVRRARGRLLIMKFILNVLWLILSGFWLALGYVAAGIICCILIITIPFGIASFRIMRLCPVAVRPDDGGAP